MFRAIEKGLPPDPSYPANLTKLGYFVTDEGRIRKTLHPDQSFQFNLTNNTRHNEVHREAMQTCTRAQVDARLARLGLHKLYLPTLSTTKPKAGPHVPIVAPPAAVLRTRKRVFVLVNGTIQDIGILAYRELQRERGINGGTILDFVKNIIRRSRPDMSPSEVVALSKDEAAVEDSHTPGFIIVNNGQLLYSHKHHQAMTLRSWQAMPRKSLAHDSIVTDPVENRIPGNRSPHEHMQFVFQHILSNPTYISPDAEVYVVGIEDGAEGLLLGVLDRDWPTYSCLITALALIQPHVVSEQLASPELRQFVRDRARSWEVCTTESKPNVLIATPRSKRQRAGALIPAKDHTDRHQEQQEQHARVDWLELASSKSSATTSSRALTTTNKSAHGHQDNDADPADPLCPTFCGGDTGVAECIFTNPVVQHAVLGFFEDVARDPVGYVNPAMTMPDRTAQDGDGMPEQPHPSSGSVEGDWTHVPMGGPKVPLARAMVNSELVRAAGLFDDDVETNGTIQV